MRHAGRLKPWGARRFFHVAARQFQSEQIFQVQFPFLFNWNQHKGLAGFPIHCNFADFSRAKTCRCIAASQRPVFANSCILSRMRSAIVSRSNWEKTEATNIIDLPVGELVSNCSRMETKATFSLHSSPINPAIYCRIWLYLSHQGNRLCL